MKEFLTAVPDHEGDVVDFEVVEKFENVIPSNHLLGTTFDFNLVLSAAVKFSRYVLFEVFIKVFP